MFYRLKNYRIVSRTFVSMAAGGVACPVASAIQPWLQEVYFVGRFTLR